MVHMQYAIQILLSSLSPLAFYLLYRSISLYITRRRLIRFHQCLPPAIYPLNPFLFGLDFFLGSLRAAKSKTYLQRIQHLYHNYGNTFALQSSPFSPPIINTIEPVNIKTILTTNFADYTAGESRRKSLTPLLGRSIFLSDGVEWAHSRALLRPSFARSQIADMPHLEMHVRNLVYAIPADGETVVDLAELFLKFAADVITDFMFGKSILSLSHPESFDARFMTAFQRAQDGGEARFRMGIFADWVPGQGRFWESVKWVHEFMDKHVDDAMRSREEAKQQASYSSNNIDSEGAKGRYIFLQEIAKISDDRKVLRDELLTILFAGRDSTAATLTNLVFELSRRPDVWQRLRQEVTQKLQGVPPSFSQLKEIEHLHDCVNETLRLYPVIPVNSRVAQRPTILPVGGGPDGKSPVFVPKGSVVAYHVHAMQRSSDLWGEDAAEFNPDRWASEEKSSLGSNFLPFNAGPRRCIGEQFALSEIYYTIIRLVQEFENIESRDPEPWTEGLGVTCTSGNGARVVVTPAGRV